MSVSQNIDQREGPIDSRHRLNALFDGFDDFTDLSRDDDPVPQLKKMLQQCPIGWSERRGGNWVLANYHNIWNVTRAPAMFSSARGVSLSAHGMPAHPPLESDPAPHTRIRALARLGNYEIAEPITCYASIRRGVKNLEIACTPGQRSGRAH
jgi:cytochrome P450